MLRFGEFITEGGTAKMHPKHKAAIRNATTFPNQNMNSGSLYLNYRMGIALAGAPDYPTEPAGALAGDPLLATYSDVELEMVNAAAKMVGAGKVTKLTDNRSTEHEKVNKTSPIQGFKGYK